MSQFSLQFQVQSVSVSFFAQNLTFSQDFLSPIYLAAGPTFTGLALGELEILETGPYKHGQDSKGEMVKFQGESH
jgi:hypothetical protein